MKKYPNVGELRTVTKGHNSYNWEQGCCFCKGKFGEDEEFMRADIQYTYMRGDDEVYCFHKGCKPGDILKAIENVTTN